MEHRTNDIDYLIGDAIENLMDKVERIEAAAAENYKAKLATAQKMIDQYHAREMQVRKHFEKIRKEVNSKSKIIAAMCTPKRNSNKNQEIPTIRFQEGNACLLEYNKRVHNRLILSFRRSTSS